MRHWHKFHKLDRFTVAFEHLLLEGINRLYNSSTQQDHIFRQVHFFTIHYAEIAYNHHVNTLQSVRIEMRSCPLPEQKHYIETRIVVLTMLLARTRVLIDSLIQRSLRLLQNR